jgi:hypothetical protein
MSLAAAYRMRHDNAFAAEQEAKSQVNPPILKDASGSQILQGSTEPKRAFR